MVDPLFAFTYRVYRTSPTTRSGPGHARFCFFARCRPVQPGDPSTANNFMSVWRFETFMDKFGNELAGPRGQVQNCVHGAPMPALDFKLSLPPWTATGTCSRWSPLCDHRKNRTSMGLQEEQLKKLRQVPWMEDYINHLTRYHEKYGTRDKPNYVAEVADAQAPEETQQGRPPSHHRLKASSRGCHRASIRRSSIHRCHCAKLEGCLNLPVPRSP